MKLDRLMMSGLCAVMLVAPGLAAAQFAPRPYPTPTRAPPPTPGATPTIDAGRIPPPAPPTGDAPRNALVRSHDGKAWIDTIDGRRSGFTFRLGSQHVIRGGGLSNPVYGAILTSRRVAREGQVPNAGSVFRFVRTSDHELIVRVTEISAGKVPWSRLQLGQRRDFVQLLLRVGGGAREMRLGLNGSRYDCEADQPNCAP